MSFFKKTNTKIYSKTDAVLTPDNVYWKELSAPVLVKEFGPIDYIDFSPVEPHYFAVTCSVRVQIYNPITKLVAKNISRFRENAYGGTFRSDGKLICAGGEETNVKLFDVGSKSLLRLFKGHSAPVHRTFFTCDKTHIASFSDDKSVRLWDIPTESTVCTFTEHADYVRAGSVSPVSPSTILSGSYDNTVKMYDTRTNSVAFSVDHGTPVESLLFMPSGGIFLSAGGTDIKIWDAFAGGRLLAKVSQHHKTITCLRLASDNKRLLSGSLDRHVKIYDTSTYKVVHTLDYPNAILSLAISNNNEHIVVGTVDGLVSISRREEPNPTKKETKKVSYKYAANSLPSTVDTVVREENKETQAKYDVCLRKFQYSKALDYVLAPYVTGKTPHVTISVMQELIQRKGLKKAMRGRENKSILLILKFLIRYIGDHRFTRVVIDVANIFLDEYEDSLPTQSAEVKKMFVVLAGRLKDEQDLSEQLASLQGALQLLLAGANVTEQTFNADLDETNNLVPSADAQKNLIISIN